MNFLLAEGNCHERKVCIVGDRSFSPLELLVLVKKLCLVPVLRARRRRVSLAREAARAGGAAQPSEGFFCEGCLRNPRWRVSRRQLSVTSTH